MKSKNENINWFPLIILFGIVINLWLASWYFTINSSELGDWGARSAFGDMFGSVNALFSGLAFAGVIYAIFLQRKELFLQRKELEQTRAELEGQKLQLEAQNRTLQKQNFENTFFELLRSQNDIINSIDLVDENNKVTRGRDCFAVFFKRYKRAWKRSVDSKGEIEDKQRINETYLEFYNDNGSEFGHYFRTLYNIIKFVNASNIENKKFYTNLVRAQLSSFELALLFYNCLSQFT